jgi:hypothetical protein
MLSNLAFEQQVQTTTHELSHALYEVFANLFK